VYLRAAGGGCTFPRLQRAHRPAGGRSGAESAEPGKVRPQATRGRKVTSAPPTAARLDPIEPNSASTAASDVVTKIIFRSL
jgi:hypothetical protein